MDARSAALSITAKLEEDDGREEEGGVSVSAAVLSDIADIVYYLSFDGQGDREEPRHIRYINCPGEQALSLRVLEDAIDAYRRGPGGNIKSQRIWEDAKAWLMTDDDDYVFSFSNVCERFGLSQDCVRRGILHGRK